MTAAERLGEMVTDADVLRAVGTALIKAVGTPDDLAARVASSLVESNLVGHDSHGVMRLPRYVAAARAGEVVTAARPHFSALRGGAGHVDGAWGWGQPAAMLAAEKAVELAAEHAVSVVTIERCNHVGRLGEHVTTIAAQGMIGLAMCNAEPVVAPFGGVERLLGTNPIAMACPRADGAPVVFDIATAGVAEGKLSVARARGEQVSPGLLVDREGVGSTDPAAFYAGGALLPFGAHKGYGLSVFIEILGGVLSGGGAASSAKYVRGNGTLVLAIDVSAFAAVADFGGEVLELSQRVAASAAAGACAPELPGDIEVRTRSEREVHGIPVPEETWTQIMQVAADLGIDAASWTSLTTSIRAGAAS